MAEYQRQENALPVKKHIQEKVCWAQGCTKRVLPATRGYRKWCSEHRALARDLAMTEANKRWRLRQGKQVGVYKTDKNVAAKTVRAATPKRATRLGRAAPKRAAKR